MANPTIGKISTALLPQLFGPELEIRKSTRGAKFTLYLSSPIGPVHLNHQKGQDFVLENGHFFGANEVEEANKPEDEPPAATIHQVDEDHGVMVAEVETPETSNVPWYERGFEV